MAVRHVVLVARREERAVARRHGRRLQHEVGQAHQALGLAGGRTLCAVDHLDRVAAPLGKESSAHARGLPIQLGRAHQAVQHDGAMEQYRVQQLECSFGRRLDRVDAMVEQTQPLRLGQIRVAHGTRRQLRKLRHRVHENEVEGVEPAVVCVCVCTHSTLVCCGVVRARERVEGEGGRRSDLCRGGERHSCAQPAAGGVEWCRDP